MKTFKRITARILSFVLVLTTIGNTYFQSRANELPDQETIDQIVQEVESNNNTGVEELTVAPPVEQQPVAGDYTEPVKPVPSEPEIRTGSGEGQEFPVGQDPGSEIVTKEQNGDVQPENDGTGAVNEVADNDVIIFYVSGQGGTVSNDRDTYNPADGSTNLNGSVAIADNGYIFKNWTAEDGNVISEEAEIALDAGEIDYLTSLYNAGGGQTTYTANFTMLETEFEAEVRNFVKVKAYVSVLAFDREVELVAEVLDDNSDEYRDAEQALQDSEKEYDTMMALDVHFEDKATGEEIEPLSPVRVEFELLPRAINNMVNSTDAVDAITSDSTIEVNHIVETTNARGQVEKAAETIADSNVEAQTVTTVPADVDLEDVNAGLDAYGEQEVMPVDVTTDANDNVTSFKTDAVVNSFSIFTFTVVGNNPAGAGTYEVPGVRIVEDNGAFTRATYENAQYVEGTAVFSKDGNGTKLVELKTDKGVVSFNKVHWVQGNNWNNPLREVADWKMEIRGNNDSFLVRPVGTDIHNNVTMYESNNANNQWGREYYFLTSDEIFGTGLAEGETAAYVYKPGTGAGQITVNGKNYVPASPKVTAVTFSGARPTLKNFRTYESVWRKSDNGNGYGKVERWDYAHSYENGWIAAYTTDDNKFHRYIRPSHNQDSSHEYVWLLHDEGVMTFNANYMERVYKRFGQFTIHYGNYGNQKQKEVVFTQGKADPVITGENYAEVWYRDGNGGDDYKTRYIKVKSWETENLGKDNAKIVAVLETVDDKGNPSNLDRVVFFDKNEDNSGKFYWLNKASEYEADWITVKVYLRYDNAVPGGNGFVNNADHLHAAVGKGKYGPAGNNTPYNYNTDWNTAGADRNDDRYYQEVQVDLGKVLQLGGRLFSWDEIPGKRGSNNFQQYYTYMSSDWNGKGADAGAGSIPLAQEFFLSTVYQAMNPEGRAFIEKKFGTFKPEALSENLRKLFPNGYVPNYVGYVLKWEKYAGNTGDDYWHIDGAISAKPSFMVELYTGMPDVKNRTLIDTMPSLKPRYYYTPDGVTPDEQTVVERFNQEFMENPKFLADEDSIHWDDPTKFVKNGNTHDMTGTFVDKDGKIKKFTVSRETSTNTAPSFIVQNDTETIQGIDPAKMQYYKGNVKYHPVTEGVFYLAIYSVRYEDVPSGNLEITKIVDDKTASGQFKNQTYKFQVLDKDGKPIHFNINNGRHTFTAKTDAPTEAEINITNGQSKSVTIYGVPTGTYTVVETYPTVAQVEADNKNLKMEVTYVPEVDGKVEIRAGETATASVVNTFTDKKGTLRFEKVFEGVDDGFLRQHMMKGLTFTLYDINGKKVTTLKGNTWAGSIALDNTAYENLDALNKLDPNDSRMGGAIIFENVPAGRYYVVETGEEVDGYDLTKTINGKAFTDDGTEVVGAVTVDVTSNEGAVITIVNKYEGNRGSLTLKKTFTGDKQGITEAQKTTTFTIYKKVGNKEEVLTVGGKKYENIPYSELTNIDATSAKLELSGLDAADYWVVENGEDGTNQVLGTIFKITTSGDEGKGKMKTLTKSGNVSFEITNNYERKFVPVVGKKIWDDKNNAESARPEKIKVRVKAYKGDSTTPMTHINGILATQYTEEFTATGNTWEIRFDEKYKYDETKGNGGLPAYTYPDGVKITYKLIEMDGEDELAENGYLNGNYVVSYSADQLTITNKYEESAGEIYGGRKGKVSPGHEKYVEKRGGEENWDGTYDLTLTVEGMQGTAENKAKVDVLFITDFSGSMTYKMDDGKERLTKLTEVVGDTIDTIRINPRLDARFAMVGFAGTRLDANGDISDTAVDTETWDDAFNVSEGWHEITTDQARNNFTGKIANYRREIAGTNYYAGLKMGKDVMDSARDGVQTVIIFVSDGAPTYYYDENGRTLGNGIETDNTPYGNTKSNVEKSYDAAMKARLSSNRFYSVFVGAKKAKAFTPVGSYTSKFTVDVMEDVTNNMDAVIKKSFSADKASELTDVFKEIASDIQKIDVNSVTIKDTLSGNAEFVEGDAALLIEVVDGKGNVIADSSRGGNGRPDGSTSVTFEDPNANNQNITMNLVRGAKDFTLTFVPADYKLNPDYSYRITAHIEPTQAAYDDYLTRGNNYPDNQVGDPGTHDHAGTTGYFSNNSNKGNTYLRYTYDGKTETETYPKPVIRLLTKKVTVHKEWANTTNQTRAESVDVAIYNASDTAFANPIKTVSLNQANNWSYTFEGLRKWKGGQELQYVLKEVGESNNVIKLEALNGDEMTYSVTYGPMTGNAEQGYEQTITNTLLKGGLTLTKTVGYDESGAEKFTDADKNAIRKALEDNLYFTIFHGGQELRTVKFSEMEGNGDTRTFNLQDAEPGQYYVEEYRDGAKVASYELTVSGEDGRASQKRLTSGGSVSFTITNTYKKIVEQEFKPADLEIHKVDDQGNLITGGVARFRLNRNGGEEKQTDGGVVKFTFDENDYKHLINANDPTNIADASVTYVLTEVQAPAGYQRAQTTWQVTVKADSVEFVQVNGVWKYVYTTKVEVNGDFNAETGTLTAINPKLRNITVKKEWLDNNNNDGVRPANAWVRLFANEVATDNVVDLEAQPNRTYTWKDLKQYDDEGREIAYTVRELWQQTGRTGIEPDANGILWLKDSEGKLTYRVTYSGDMEQGFTVTNARGDDKVVVRVEKFWSDVDNRDGKRPDSVWARIKADPVSALNGVTTDVDLAKQENLAYTWENLPAKVSGQPVTYEVVELDNGREVSASSDNKTLAGKNGAVYTVAFESLATTSPQMYSNTRIINSYTPELIPVTVTKIWNDKDNQDGVRPANVRLGLFKVTENGEEEVRDAVPVTGTGNEWTWTFNNLPKYEGGKEVKYVVREFNGDTKIGEGGKLPSIEDGKEYTATYKDLTVTNTYNPKPIEITVTKLWDDNRNNDGVRPDSIVVTLTGTAKDKEVYTNTVTISTTNAASVGEQEITVDGKKKTVDVWTYTFTGLDENYEGSKIIYTMKENPVVGYLDPVYSADQLTVRNPYSDTTTDVSGFKTWKDNNNQDGVRPAELEIKLIGKVGDEVVYEAKQTITGVEHGAAATTAQKWAYKFTGLPKKDKGREITYTIEETVTKEMKDAGYETPIYDEPHLNVENPRPVDKTKIVVEKNWDDKDNQDGLRKAVNVRVYKVAQGGNPANINDLTAVGDIKQLGTAQGATVTFDGLDVNEGGKPITYVAYELDANNQPIFAGGKLAVDYGKFYDVSYAEKTPATGVSKHTVVTNKYVPEQIPVEIHKIWDDNSDNDGVRKEVTLQLYKKSGTEFVPVDGTRVTLKAESYSGDNWTYKYTQLFDKYENGRQEIVYEVRELNGGKVVEVNGDIPSKDPERNYTLTKYDGLSVTNKIDKATTERSGKKTWGDNQNQDGARPKSITLTITGAVTINGADEVVYGPETKVVNAPAGENTLAKWDYKFENLPKFYQKQEINYTMTEEQVSGYGTPVVTGFDVTNPYNLEDTSVSGKKNWADSNNQDGKRPEKIEVTLTGTIKNGAKEVFGPVTFEVSEKSIYVWDATAKELKLNDAESVILAPGADNRKAQWEYAISKLPKKAEGEVIVYAVKETPLDAALGYGEADQDGFNFTNPRTNDQVKVVVEKNWADNENQDGKRKGINVRLYKTDLNGAVVAASEVKTLGTEQSATVTFEGLDKNQGQGTPIVYFVRELDDKLNPVENGKTVIDVYTVTYEADKQLTPEEVEAKVAQHMLVTNTYAPVNIDVQAEKEWIDNNDQDGVRPESVRLALYKNGSDTPVQGPVAVSRKDGETNIWKHKFTGVPKYENGVEIVYTVREYDGDTVVEEGGDLPSDGGYAPYKAHYEGLRVTNTYIPETTDFDGVKTWGDNKNQDGKRPTSITITLTGTIPDGNGGTKEVYKTKETFGGDMTAETWSFSFGNTLPRFAEGKEITYRVTEEQITGYEAPQYDYEYEGVDVNVTNPYNPDTTDVSGRKIWGDNRNQDGVRPEKVEVELTGTIVKDNKDKQVLNVKFDVSVKSVYVWDSKDKKLNLVDAESTVLAPNAADNKLETWEYIVRKLPKKAEGVDITYTVKETPLGITGYGEPKETGFDVENPYTSLKTSIVVEKNWDDVNNQDGLRQNIRVQLYKVVNGVEVAVPGQTATIGMTDGDTAWFKDLELNEDGNPVVYVVRELDALGNPILENNGKLSVKNGKEYDVTYDQDVNGENVTEADKKEAANVSKHLKVKNSYVPEEIDIPIEKIWRDTNYTDVRPATVVVELVRTDNKDLPAGVKAKAQITLDADGDWKGVWTDLPKFENEGPANENNAVEIPYDVKELKVKSTNNMDYTVVKTGSRTSGFVITNTIVEKPTQQPVIKIWEDAKDHDGIRPKNITVGLFANGELIKSQSISVNDKAVEGKEWSYVFTGLPLRDAKGTITYTVGEMVEGGNAQDKADYIIATGKYNDAYDTFVVGNEITNRHDHKIDKEVKKANGTWEGEIKLENNKEVFEYRFGTAIPDRKDLESFVITDDIHSEMTIVSTKAEIEASLPDAVRDAAEVDITGNTVKISWKFAEVDGNNNITYMNQALKGEKVSAVVKAKFKNPDSINLQAPGVVAGRFPNTVRYNIDDEDDHWSNDVWVQPKQEETEVPVTKIWDDMDNYDKVRPTNITVGVFAPKEKGGTELVLAADAKTINASNKDVDGKEWSYKFTGLVKNYPDGTAIPYTIGELVQNGNKDDMNDWILVSGNLNTNYQTFVDQTKREITNRHNPKIDKEVKGEEQDEKAYKKEELILSKSGEKFDYRVSTAVPKTDSKGEPTVKFMITDTLTPALVFESGADDVIVKVGEKDNLETVTGDNRPAVVINKKTLTVTFEGTALTNALGKKVTVEFRASIDPEEDLTPYVEGPIAKNGMIPNDVDYTINLDDPVPSEKVWVKPFDEKTNIPVKKIWEDANNYDKIRPTNITVGLFQSTEDNIESAKLVAYEQITGTGKEWSHEFKDQPVRQKSGKRYYYFVGELRDGGNRNIDADWIKVSGAFMTTKDAAGNDVTVYAGEVDQTKREITNTHDHKINKAVKVKEGTWTGKIELEDNSDEFEYRFKTAIPDRATLNSFVIRDTLKDLLVFANGDDTTVTIEPADVAALATPVINGRDLEITWTFAEDDGNSGVNYINQEIKGKEVTITVAAKIENPGALNLNKDYLVNGAIPNTVRYQIDQDPEKTSDDVYVKPKTDYTTITVKKTWDDKSNKDNVRPTSVEFILYADGTEVASKTMVLRNFKDMDEWTWKFEKDYDGNKLPVLRKDGTPVEYTIDEVVLDNDDYTMEVDENDRFHVTNTYKPKTVDITVEKVWDDDDNRDNLRKPEIEFELKAYQTVSNKEVEIDLVDADGKAVASKVKVNEANGWKDEETWKNLPKMQSKLPIRYDVVEITVDGYDVTKDMGTKVDKQVTTYSYKFTNVHEPKKTFVDVEKIWEDNFDQDGYRPENITVVLKASVDGQPYDLATDSAVVANGIDLTKTLATENGWKARWDKLNALSNGKTIEYTVEEVAVAKYDSEVKVTEPKAGEEEKGWTVKVTNTHVPEKTRVIVDKKWEDNDDQDGARPETLKVQLLKNGSPEGDPKELNEGNKWHAEWDNLDKLQNKGKTVRYDVVEVSIDGYTGTTKRTPEKFEDAAEERVIEITNKHIPGITDVSVTKEWDDGDNQDGIRPTEVYIQLYADGVAVDEYETVDDDGKKTGVKVKGLQKLTADPDNWSFVWTRLALKKGGQLINYTVKEVDENGKELANDELKVVITDGVKKGEYTYKVETKGKDNVWTVKNTYEPKKINIPVEKIWNDADNYDGTRPNSITVKLVDIREKNGQIVENQIGEEKVLSEALNNWKYEWKDLDQFYDGGKTVGYRVEEIAYTIIEDGKEVAYTGIPEGYAVRYSWKGTVSGTEIDYSQGAIIDNAHNPVPKKEVDSSDAILDAEKTKAELKARDQVFTFRIKAAVPELIRSESENPDGTKKVEELTKFVITDTLNADLVFENAEQTKVNVNYKGGNVVIDGQKLTVTFEGAQTLEAIKGKEVVVEFTAKFAPDANVSKYLVAGKTGIPNTAEVTFFGPDNNPASEPTNEVTVTPPDPPITKEVATPNGGSVNDAKNHALLAARNEEFTYTLKTTIPEREMTEYEIFDQVVPELGIRGKVVVTIGGAQVADDSVMPSVKVESNTVKVTFTGDAAKAYLAEHAGEEVVVTFNAKIVDEANISQYFEGEETGVPNTAKYTYKFPDGQGGKDSNKVTVTPPDPPIDKEVNGEKKYELKKDDEPVTYTIITKIPEKQLESFEITDKLVDVLEFVSKENDVRVKEFTLDAQDNRVEGGNVGATVKISGQTLTVSIAKEFLQVSKGKNIMVSFEAKVKDGATAAQLKPYLVDTTSGIPNEASYTYKFGNDSKTKPSEPVHIIPADPEIRKNVVNEKGESHENNKLHADLVERYGVYPYTITTEMPKKANVVSFSIHDELEDVLEYVSDPGDVDVKVGGKSAGTNAVVKISTDKQVLDVTFDGSYVNEHMGETVVVTVRAKIENGKNLLTPDNYTVTYNVYPPAPHTGRVRIPNKANYEILYNEAGAQANLAGNGTTAVTGNDGQNALPPADPGRTLSSDGTSVKVDSNYVTVTPPDPKIEKEVHNAADTNSDKTYLKLETPDEVYNYVVKTQLPERQNLTRFEIRDTLEKVLEFAPANDGNVVVAKVVNGTLGTPLTKGSDYTVSISGQTITVSFTNSFVTANAGQGQEVGMKFDAKVRAGANLTGYQKNAAGDVLVPNKVVYQINNEPEVDSEPVDVTPKEERIEIPVEKLWEDDDNRDGRRPQEITVRLFGGDNRQLAVQTLKEVNGEWKATFKDLPKYEFPDAESATGRLIAYKVVEDPVMHYGEPKVVTQVTENGVTISSAVLTNPYDPEKTTVSVIKSWNDGNNGLGARPSSITVRLLADGEAAKDADGNDVAALTLNESNGWKGTFTNLHVYRPTGVEIEYTVTEDAVEGYQTKITENGTYAFLIENVADSGRLTVVKSVVGDVGHNIGYTFVVTNALTGAEVARLTINGSGEQTIAVPAGSYTVTEVGANNSTVANYTLVTAGSGRTVTVPVGGSASVTIVNVYTPPTPPPVENPPVQGQPPIEAGQVLGVRRTDSEQVLGARRGKTGDKSNEGRLMTMMASGAAALLALLTGRRKRKLEDED